MSEEIADGDSARAARAAAAERIALQATALARLATENRFGMLAYLIDQVVLEAWREATEGADSEAAET